MKKHASAQVRTTLSLPIGLLEATDAAVRRGVARSRNEFIALAIRHELAAQEHARIDREFSLMAEDSAYQQEAVSTEQQFAAADWEAFRLSEGTDRR